MSGKESSSGEAPASDPHPPVPDIQMYLKFYKKVSKNIKNNIKYIKYRFGNIKRCK